MCFLEIAGGTEILAQACKDTSNGVLEVVLFVIVHGSQSLPCPLVGQW